MSTRLNKKIADLNAEEVHTELFFEVCDMINDEVSNGTKLQDIAEWCEVTAQTLHNWVTGVVKKPYLLTIIKVLGGLNARLVIKRQVPAKRKTNTTLRRVK